jgi:hypothetical protein
MAVLGLTESERMSIFSSIGLLPDLEEEILFIDLLIPDFIESFENGMEDWWGDFIAGSNL